MPELFRGSQICEMAVETEIKGYTYYQAVAASAKNKAVKDFCLKMAAAEREHEATFKAMLSALEMYNPPEGFPGEYLEYIDSLVQRSALPCEEEGKRLAASAKSELEAVDFAIQFEKNTILFLHEMRNFVPPGQRAVVDRLIDEERSHVTGLTALRKTIAA